jgi:predicted AAA+ superfamily ATPase
MKETLKTIIREQQEKTLPEIKPRKLEIPVQVPVIISLIGARRCGKTYLLYAAIQKLLKTGIPQKNIVYFNFEDERLNLQAEQLDLILQSFYELYPETPASDCFFFFDEIQNVDGWEKFVRRMFDNVSKNIFITGSNSKLLSTEIATSLRGRTLTYTVFPLSLNEYFDFRAIDHDIYRPQKKALLISETVLFIRNGGFPEPVNFETGMRTILLQAYFNTMIYRDIVERYKISDPAMLKFFVKKIVSGIGKPLSINKIYNDLRSLGYKVSNNYLYNFLDYCNTIFLTIPVARFHFSEIKQEKSDKKIYCIDTGLLSSIEFSVSQNNGKLFENMVLLEFIKAGVRVFYYKDNYECDFIIQINENLYPIQVTYNFTDVNTKKREIRGLIEACKAINVSEGTIITLDQKTDFVENNIHIKVIPVYEFFQSFPNNVYAISSP